jgi:hypothetical protein
MIRTVTGNDSPGRNCSWDGLTSTVTWAVAGPATAANSPTQKPSFVIEAVYDPAAPRQ